MQEYNQSNPSERPDSESIAALLEKFQPKPSAAFQARMQSTPWKLEAASPRRNFSRYAWRFTIVLLVVSVFFLFTPFAGGSLKATANRLLQFFIPASSDQTAIQVTIPPTDGTSALNPQTDFAASLQAVMAEAPFNLQIPMQIPEDYILNGANYTAIHQQAALYYSGDKRSLILVQHPVGNFFEQIGESARVEIIREGEITYEYVIGGWVIRGKDGEILATALPGTTVTLNAYWDNSLDRQTLRWQKDDIQFELISYGELDRQTMLSIAANMR
ncbi:MAG: hypothetical protein JXB38_20980 [Anaerolineales bacterium]|nr:hypothetical protein [Anaerolineales bacterium]